MKTFKLIAIASCTLAIAACGSGTETDSASIDDVGGSAYQQALGADGQVDCDRIHNVLWDHGIDPAQLEPDFVFEACVNSGTPEDTCQLVAYSCFGNPGCSDPHPPEPPVDPNCEEFYQLAEQTGLDPTNLGPDEVFQYCINANYPDDICAQAYQCFPAPPQPEPDPNDMCDEARQLAEQLGIDIEGMSPEELLNVCMDQNYDEQLCWAILEQCVDPNNPGQPGPNDPDQPDDDTDPNGVSCDEVEQLLADQGIDVPQNDADAQSLYEVCIQHTNDDQLCHAALNCVYP